MATDDMDDLYAGFRFLIEIDGFIVGAFSECSGLSADTNLIEYRDDSRENTLRKLPNLMKDSNINLKRGVTQNMELREWMKTITNGYVVKKNGIITLLNEAREPVCKWRFENGWPTIFVAGPTNTASNEVAIEVLEIAHEGLTILSYNTKN